MRIYVQVPEEDLTEFTKLMEKNHIMYTPDGNGYYKTKTGKIIYQFWCEKNRGKGRPSKRIPKEKIKELKSQGMTINAISKELGIARSSVYNYLNMEEEMNKKVKAYSELLDNIAWYNKGNIFDLAKMAKELNRNYTKDLAERKQALITKDKAEKFLDK